MSGLFDGAEVISVYTAEQAVEDGLLVPVADDILGPGVTMSHPVYITSHLWGDVEDTDPAVTRANTLNLLRAAALAFGAGDPSDLMRTRIEYVQNPSGALHNVWGVIDGAGLTLMHPEDY